MFRVLRLDDGLQNAVPFGPHRAKGSLTTVHGPGSGEFFQDTLQVHPCKLLASLPAGDGPERTHRSLSSASLEYEPRRVSGRSSRAVLRCQEQQAGAGSLSRELMRQGEGETSRSGREVAWAKPHSWRQRGIHAVSRERVPAAGCAPKPNTGKGLARIHLQRVLKELTAPRMSGNITPDLQAKKTRHSAGFSTIVGAYFILPSL